MDCCRFAPGQFTLALLAIVAWAAPAFAQTPKHAADNRRDVKPKDFRKGAIEIPVKKVLASRTSNKFAESNAESGKPAGDKASKKSDEPDGFNNPKVQPGKVRWHDSFPTAQAKSKRSGKPVLLFQLIGRLDERFS